MYQPQAEAPPLAVARTLVLICNPASTPSASTPATSTEAERNRRRDLLSELRSRRESMLAGEAGGYGMLDCAWLRYSGPHQ